MDTDAKFMNRALSLAKRGIGKVSPNPTVGAVIVKDGRIIGEGYHMRYGGAHAERNAIDSCTESAAGSTLYVTLEPCAHYGKQPPCTDAIIAAGISRVVVGSPDPNPAVNGKGVAILREHGIEVTENVLRERCDRQNEIFFKYVTSGLPFVAIKYAMTVDGKIATASGRSKWITGTTARRHAHGLRNKYSAIAVGVNTVICDDPMLTCRLRGGKDPVRVICDTRLRTPLDSNVVKTASVVRTVIATCSDDAAKIREYEARGAEVWRMGGDGKVDLTELVRALGSSGIDGLLIEGGGALNYSALACGIVDKVYAYISPKIIGGKNAVSPIGGAGFCLADAVKPSNVKIARLGEDLLIEGDVICLRE